MHRSVYCLLCVIGILFLYLPRAHAQDRQGELYLLAIGVSQYPHLTETMQLRFADDDASAMVRWAEGQKGHLYRNVHTKLLTNAQGTRSNVVSTLLEFFRGATERDQIIVFMAGHGMVDTVTQRYHFLTHETKPDQVAATALAQADLLEKLALSSRRCQRILLLLDTCQSGALAELDSVGTPGTRGLALKTDLDLVTPPDRSEMFVVMAAGLAEDLALEGEHLLLPWEKDVPGVEGHGLFTHYLLRGLQTSEGDLNHNGLIGLGELWQWVSDGVKTSSHGKQIPQISGRLTDAALAWAPGTQEICDGLDNDLDGALDEGFDHNRNGLGDCLEQELCDGLDNNADGHIDEGFDLDGDGHRSRALCGSRHGDDCDDARFAIHPDQQDWANLQDDDCDGFTDEDTPQDRWNPKVPDGLEQEYRAKLRIGLPPLGAGLLLLGAGTIQWMAWNSALRQITLDGVVTPTESADFRVRTLACIGLTGAGLVSLGVSGHFLWQAGRMKVELFPAQRK